MPWSWESMRSGAALSLDTNVEIIDLPGYAPLVNDTELIEVTKEAAALALPDLEYTVKSSYSTGSTDMGDLSCVMPVVQPYAGGARGKSHGNDYEIYDPELACVDCAKWQLAMLLILLRDGAVRANSVIQQFEPMFDSFRAFLDYQDSIFRNGNRIEYGEDGIARVDLK